MKVLRALFLSAFLLIGMMGYAQQDFEEDLFELSLEELMNLEITSVSRVGEGLNESPAVVTIISHDMIRENGYRTIYDAVRDVPGFWAIQDVNDKLIGVRGVHASTSQKFLLLINGKKITENLWNLTDIDYNISLENVKRIEIIRGPGSAIYGRAALTAVINVVTFTGEEIDGLQLDMSLGNHGYRKFGVGYGTKTESGNEIEVYGHLVSIAGETVDVPMSEDGAANRINGTEVIDKFKFPTGGLGARFHNDLWDVNIHWQQRIYQQQRSAGAQLNWQDIESNTDFSDAYKDQLLGEEHNFIVFDLQRNFNINKVSNSLSFAYTYSRLRLRESTIPLRDVSFDASATAEDTTNYGLGQMFEFDLMSHRYGLEYIGSVDFNEKSSAVWGLEAYETVPLSDKFTSNYVSVVDPGLGQLVKTPTENGYYRELIGGTFDKMRSEQLYSAFAEFKVGLMSNLKLNIGGRYDVHVKGDDYRQSSESDRYPDPTAEQKRQEIQRTTSQFSPRMALVYLPFEKDVLITKLIYNKSFIAPGYFYRYADPSTSYAGGPWLKAETLDNFMFSAETINKNITLRLVGFLNINKDLLTRDNTLTPARYTSLGKLAMHGVELDGVYRIRSLSVNANYSFMKGNKSYSDDASTAAWIMSNGSVKNFPTHYGNIGLSMHFIDRQLSLTLNNRWYGEILSPIGAGEGAGTVASIDPAVVTNFTVRYQPKQVNNFDVNLSVYNLFDKDVMLGGTVKRPYNQAGRWFNISVLKKF